MNLGKDDLHVCPICGTEYHACDKCVAGTHLAFREVCDTKEHFEVQQVIAKYCSGYLTAEEAKEQLQKCDLKDMAIWKDDILIVATTLLGIEDTKEEKAVTVPLAEKTVKLETATKKQFHRKK